MNSGKYFGKFIEDGQLRLHNPTVEDVISNEKHKYISLLLADNEEDISFKQLLFSLYIMPETHDLVEKALFYWLPDYDSLYVDETKIVVGLKQSNQTLELTDTLLEQMREHYKQIFSSSDPNEIPKEKIKFKNERQRKLWERREQTRKQLAEAKKRSGSAQNFGIGDLIIAVCVLGHYTNEQVLKFPFAFAQDMLTHLQKKEHFNIEIQTAVFAKNASLKYWLG